MLRINTSSLTCNGASNSGGVFLLLNKTRLTVNGASSTFIGNKALNGGVMYASDSQVDILSQNLLTANNRANGYGGALYLTIPDDRKSS